MAVKCSFIHSINSVRARSVCHQLTRAAGRCTELLLLFLLFLFLLCLLTLCARLVVHNSPSAVQAQHLAIENAKDGREEYGQPKHHEQDSQDRGPDPESLRIEYNVAKLNCSVGEDT